MNTLNFNAWIVDDDLIYQNFLSSFLIGAGFNTKGFCCGEECLKNLHQKPDVIILDENPGNEYGGVDFLRKIKEKQPDIPVIYTSVIESVYHVSEAFRNGSVDYIEKDCASLIRIKIRLDKIKKLKTMKRARLRKRISLFMLAGAACVAIGFLMHHYVVHISISLNLR